jgi:hypothetical protein
MKRYHVITRRIGVGEHSNFEELLPAPCTYITGVFATAFGKKALPLSPYKKELDFPYSVLVKSANDKLRTLFYTYLRSRPTLSESKSYFVSKMHAIYIEALSDFYFSSYSAEANEKIKSNVNDAIIGLNEFEGHTSLKEYLFVDNKIYESTLSDGDFIDLMLKLAIEFLYHNRSQIFCVDAEHYVQEKDVEVGNVTLLLNGNNFILRDYAIVANRQLKPIKKEVIALNEPLDVNSSLKVVFKNKVLDADVLDDLSVKIYIEYEHQRITA